MRKFLWVVLILAATCQPLFAENAKLNVVATTTFNADLVRKIGGDQVDVKSVASPKFNVHFIQPKPSDVRNLARADLYVNSGLDLEAWSDPLAEAAGNPDFFRGGPRSIDLSENIRLLNVPTGALSRAYGDVHLFGNPHYHLSPENAKGMAVTLAEKLAAIDAAHADDYRKNAQAFTAELDRRILAWKSECAHCAGKEVYAYHDELEYLAHFLGLKSNKFLEPKPGIPPTPKHIQELEEYAKANGVKAILQPSYFSRSAAEELARRIEGKIVTFAHNVGEEPGTEDIFSFYDFNVKQIAEALK